MRKLLVRKLQSGAEPQEPSSDVKATASLMLELVMVAGFGRVQDWTKDETQAQTNTGTAICCLQRTGTGPKIQLRGISDKY
jgi:hypothetical protein